MTTWSTSASVQIKGLATKYTTVNGLLEVVGIQCETLVQCSTLLTSVSNFFFRPKHFLLAVKYIKLGLFTRFGDQ